MDYTDQQKRIFYTSGYFNRWKLNFQEINITVDNETIHTESPTIKESICESEDLILGGCIASSFSFEVSEILEYELTGLEFTAHLETVSEDGRESLVTPMGRYRVDSAETLDDKDYKQVTAYDSLYDASEDVSEWYQVYFADNQQHTVKETRVSLLEFFGIPIEDQTLTNDDVLLNKTIDPNGSLTGITVLRALCEINGGFGRMNRQGRFEVIHLQGLGVFPEDQRGEEQNLYPEDTLGKEMLYPEDHFEYLGISDYVNDYPEWRSVTAEDYMTPPISCLNIRDAEDGIGVTVGDDLSNPYIITGNLFLYGKSPEELGRIGVNILSRIKGITYRPNTTELNGLPYMETGDVYAMLRKNDPLESYVLSRTLKGIGVLVDTFEAKGNKIRANEVSANEEIVQLKGKTLTLKKAIDEFSIELKDLEEGTESKFEQTASAISAETKRASDAEGELLGKIQVEADRITSEVSRASEKEGELSSIIEQSAESIVLKVDSNGNMAEVALGMDADDPSATKFTVTAKNIELSAEEAINLLAGGTLNLSAKDISIESDSFSVDADGKVEAKSLYVTGGSINIETCLDGENVILFRNAVYEGAYDGPIRFFESRTPPLPKNIGAKYGDFYYDTLNKILYKCTGISGTDTLFWTTMFNDAVEIPEIPPIPIRFYGDGGPKESPEDMDARMDELYVDLESGDIYYVNSYSQNNNFILEWKRQSGISMDLRDLSWKELTIGTESGIEITKYNWIYFEENGEYYKVADRISIQSDGIELGRSGYTVKMGTVRPFESSGSIKLEEEIDEENNVSPSIVFDVPVKAPNIN